MLIVLLLLLLLDDDVTTIRAVPMIVLLESSGIRDHGLVIDDEVAIRVVSLIHSSDVLLSSARLALLLVW